MTQQAENSKEKAMKLTDNPQVKNFVEEVNTELVENNDIVATHCFLDTDPKHRILCVLKDEYPLVHGADAAFFQYTFNFICNFTKRPRVEPDEKTAVEMIKLVGDLAHAMSFICLNIEMQQIREVISEWIETYKDNKNEWVQLYIKNAEEYIRQARSHKIAVIQKKSK
ncbi:MAG: hypothetical protein IJV56_08560 [Neisseriaceae bacterium]|nr:hypothetical protein [Neisseriaceae bacterium]